MAITVKDSDQLRSWIGENKKRYAEGEIHKDNDNCTRSFNKKQCKATLFHFLLRCEKTRSYWKHHGAKNVNFEFDLTAMS